MYDLDLVDSDLHPIKNQNTMKTITLKNFEYELQLLKHELDCIEDYLLNDENSEYAISVNNRKKILRNIIHPMDFIYEKSSTDGCIDYSLRCYDPFFWQTALDWRCINVPIENLGYQEVRLLIDPKTDKNPELLLSFEVYRHFHFTEHGGIVHEAFSVMNYLNQKK